MDEQNSTNQPASSVEPPAEDQNQQPQNQNPVEEQNQPTEAPAQEQSEPPTETPAVDQGEQPEDPAPAPSPEEQPASQPAPSGGGTKKVLLVEDDNNLADVYTTRLQAEGFDTKRVPNGEEALASALEYKPDLILLDVMMPKVSGFDVLDILRNTPETAKVKIVMLTALGQETDQQRAKDLGVDDYLVKSQVVIADVVDKIKFHLGM